MLLLLLGFVCLFNCLVTWLISESLFPLPCASADAFCQFYLKYYFCFWFWLPRGHFHVSITYWSTSDWSEVVFEHLKAVRIPSFANRSVWRLGNILKIQITYKSSLDFAFRLVPVSLLCVYTRTGVQQGCVIARALSSLPCSCSELQTYATFETDRASGPSCLFSCVELSVTFLASLTVCYLPRPQALCDVNLSHLCGTGIATISDSARGMGFFCILLTVKSGLCAGEGATCHGPPCPGQTPKPELGGRGDKEVIVGISSRLKGQSPSILPQSSVVFLEKVFCEFYLPLIASRNGCFWPFCLVLSLAFKFFKKI